MVERARTLQVDAEARVEPPELAALRRRGRRRRRRGILLTVAGVTVLALGVLGAVLLVLRQPVVTDAGHRLTTAAIRWRLSQGPGTPRARVVLDRGWTGDVVLVHDAGDGQVGLLVAEVDRVARTPCVPGDQGMVEVGDGSAEVAARIAEAPGLEEVVAAREVTAFGRFAVHLLLRTTDAGCAPGGRQQLLGTPQGDVRTPTPGSALELWVVDVGGRAVVVMGSSSPDADADGRALLHEALASVQLDVPCTGASVRPIRSQLDRPCTNP